MFQRINSKKQIKKGLYSLNSVVIQTAEQQQQINALLPKSEQARPCLFNSSRLDTSDYDQTLVQNYCL